MKKEKEDIENIIQRCIYGDIDAWDKLVKCISPLITYTIQNKFSRLGFNYQKNDIENLKQDILLSIWEKNKLHTIKNKNKAVPWICALSSHAASNYVRNLTAVDPPNVDPLPLDELLKSDYPLPSKEASNKEIQDAIDRAIESLNYQENLIIKLSLLYGKKFKDISQILNIPLGTILVYAGRAKLKLKKKLKKYRKNM